MREWHSAWIRPGVLALACALLLARVPRLGAAALNSLAARALLHEWAPVSANLALPRCAQWLERSAAEPYLALAARWDPGSVRVALNRGRAAWLAGDCAAAAGHWAEAAHAAPHDAMAPYWLFWAWGADPGRLPAGITAKGLAQWAHMSGSQARATEGEEALAWYALSLALHPGRDPAAAIAQLFAQAGQSGDAAAVWQGVAAALPPDDAERWWALGQAYELEADLERAAAAYERGAGLAAEPLGFWMRLAAVYRKLERPRDEERAYHGAIRACPDCRAPYLELGHLWRRQGQFEGALGWYREAERVSSGDPSVGYYQAQALYGMGERARAAEALAQAMALHRGTPWQWAVQLGDWRLELGDREGALVAYRQALEWQPGEAAIRERIDQASQ